MSSPIDQRAALERLIRERNEDYAGLSRLIGRNAAYIQQFIKRGVPRKLDEKDRLLLARYFGVDEAALGGPPGSLGQGDRFVAVPRLDIDASAGPGALAGEERTSAHFGFDEKWLRRLVPGRSPELSMIQVRGDSMVPTLTDGDDILVDRSDAAGRLRDGIYVLRRDDALMVKRIALSPAARTIAIRSDNPAYPSWPEIDLASVDIIGRVIWAGRRIG
jgi:phage repressor protein C with HTH and peptisase S24 domain